MTDCKYKKKEKSKDVEYKDVKINIDDEPKPTLSYDTLIKNGHSSISAYLHLIYEYYYDNNNNNSKMRAREYCIKAVDECLKHDYNFDNKYYETAKDVKSIAYMANTLGVCKDRILELYKIAYSIDDSDICMIRDFAKLLIEGKCDKPDYEGALNLYITNENIKIEDKVNDVCEMTKNVNQKKVCVRKLFEYIMFHLETIKQNNINLTTYVCK